MVSKTKVANDGQPVPESAQLAKRRSEVEEFRQTAIDLDRELMSMVRRKRELENRRRPGINESRQNWHQRVEKAKKDLQLHQHAEEGSVEWEYRQGLLRSLEDRPR